MTKVATPIVILSLAAAGACTAAERQAPQSTADCAAQTASVDELITRSSAIVLAEAVGGAAGEPTADLRKIQDEARKGNDGGERIVAGNLPVQLFSALDYLKGEGAETFSVIVAAPAEPTAPVPHDSDAFWEDASAGRAVLTDDCRVEADFAAGERYLIFIGPQHVKAYEPVAVGDDAWLAYVRAKLDG
jgi:hypothetical protein